MISRATYWVRNEKGARKKSEKKKGADVEKRFATTLKGLKNKSIRDREGEKHVSSTRRKFYQDRGGIGEKKGKS